MSKIKVHLNPLSILTVPLQKYLNDFSFIVNGKEFKTSRLVTDLLSPKISQIHLSDPTIDTFLVNTHHDGDFSHILNLTNFEETGVESTEIQFLSEVIEILGNKSIERNYDDNIDITVDNVLTHLQEHEQCSHFYCNHISKEIEFASSHFDELFEKRKEQMKKLSISTLKNIISNDHLRLKNEDQLLKFINELYSNNSEYTILYETVLFSNVSSQMMIEFLSVFDVNDMTMGAWKELSKRLRENLSNSEETKGTDAKRYLEEPEKVVGTTFEYTKDKEFKGIFNYLFTKSGGQIQNEVEFTSSSTCGSNYPINVVLYGEDTKRFHSEDSSNEWVCFDFKEHRVIPTHYTMKSMLIQGGIIQEIG